MTPPVTPLGRQAFDRLQAEYETTWLADVYVEPLGFEGLAGMRSIAVFGEEGAGKTALQTRMTQFALLSKQRPLIVKWYPPLESSHDEEEITHEFLIQVMDACVQELLLHIGCNPNVFNAAPNWVQGTVIWFINQYLTGDQEFRLMRLEVECPPENMVLLNDIISRKPPGVLPDNSPAPRVIAEVAQMLLHLGVAGVWVMVDGLESWLGTGITSPERAIKALLATLAIFENPAFVLKLAAPIKLEAQLSPNEGFIRRRCAVHRLTWTREQLTLIVERRLATAVSKDTFRLSDLCDGDSLKDYLEKYGGLSPYGWLELTRPVIDQYLSKPVPAPFSADELAQVQRLQPPRLRVDLDLEKVFIGYGFLEGLSASNYKLLRYLYENRVRPCTRRELYFRAYRGLDKEPRSVMEMGAEHTNWENTIDTAIWRLRGVIEPRPNEPIYVVSDQGRGTIRLENVW